jgi:hypothetical protein
MPQKTSTVKPVVGGAEAEAHVEWRREWRGKVIFIRQEASAKVIIVETFFFSSLSVASFN